MPTQKYYNLVDHKKDGILRAMGEELLEHSYQEITVSRIIGRAGISRASFYGYFKDKEDMLGCIFRRLKEDMTEQFLRFIREEEGNAFRGGRRFLEYLLEDESGWSVCRIYHSLHNDPESRERMFRLEREWHREGMFARFVHRCYESLGPAGYPEIGEELLSSMLELGTLVIAKTVMFMFLTEADIDKGKIKKTAVMQLAILERGMRERKEVEE